MNDFDDDEIARAIALSLQESNAAHARGSGLKGPPEVIEILDDDEDDENDVVEATPSGFATPGAGAEVNEQYEEDLRRAIEASKAEAEAAKNTTTATRSTPASNAATPEPQAPRATTSFLLDRAAMERDRLARQKRLRPDITETRAAEEVDDEDEDEDDEPSHSKRPRISASVHSRASSAHTGTNSAAGPSTSRNADPGGQMFWDGEIRQTANAHVDRMKDTKPLFRLCEIIAPVDELEFAIIGAYVIDWSWLYSFFKKDTPVVVVTQDSEGQETIKEVLPQWIKVTPFFRGGHGCMHSKFLLLFYKSGRLRIAIPTANLIYYDWRDIENTVWVQDVPRRPQGHPASPLKSRADKDFPTIMADVLRTLNVPAALLNHQRNGQTLPIIRVEHLREHWDFSKVQAQLVPSFAGRREGWRDVVQSGHPRLMKAVRDLRLRATNGRELVLEYQGSSIGTYSTQWVNEFFCSARGESAQTWLDTKKSVRMKLPYPSTMKILFPTLSIVRNSVFGERGGGTMFCRRSQWQAAKFPRELFHVSKSKRGPVLMHSKMMIATFRQSAFASSSSNAYDSASESETEPEDDEVVEVTPTPSSAIGWVYVGSHNFTPSAWGTLSGSAFNPVLNTTNFELGVVLPLKDERELERVACFERPPRKYGKDDIPWFQEEFVPINT